MPRPWSNSCKKKIVAEATEFYCRGGGVDLVASLASKPTVAVVFGDFSGSETFAVGA